MEESVEHENPAVDVGDGQFEHSFENVQVVVFFDVLDGVPYSRKYVLCRNKTTLRKFYISKIMHKKNSRK